jgi:hypothetical protein
MVAASAIALTAEGGGPNGFSFELSFSGATKPGSLLSPPW